MKKIITFILVVGFVFLTVGCAQKTYGMKDGTYTASESKFTDGYKNTVTVKIKNGKITEVDWDAIGANGAKSKKQASIDGEYVLPDAADLKWHEQAKILTDKVVNDQAVNIQYDAGTGKTDSIDKVTVSVMEFAALANNCIRQAKGEKEIKYYDGTFTVEQASYENNYKYFVVVTIKNDKITSVVWDAYKEVNGMPGKNKRQESIDGEYVMVVDEEGNPMPGKLLWHEQAEVLENKVVKDQGLQGIMYDSNTGKTDTITGVSISISPFMELVGKALDDAKI